MTTGKLGCFFVDKSTAFARAAQGEQERQLHRSAAQCWFTFITAEPQHSLPSVHNVHTDQKKQQPRLCRELCKCIYSTQKQVFPGLLGLLSAAGTIRGLHLAWLQHTFAVMESEPVSI